MAVRTRSPIGRRREALPRPARVAAPRLREDQLSATGLHGGACSPEARLEDIVLSALASLAEGSSARCPVCGEAELAAGGCRGCGSALER